MENDCSPTIPTSVVQRCIVRFYLVDMAQVYYQVMPASKAASKASLVELAHLQYKGTGTEKWVLCKQSLERLFYSKLYFRILFISPV